MGKGGVKNMPARPTPTPTTSSRTYTHTHTHNHSPSPSDYIMLSAAPVRQTVRGSLDGVPLGSVIGLLEEPPVDWTPIDRKGFRGQGVGVGKV